MVVACSPWIVLILSSLAHAAGSVSSDTPAAPYIIGGEEAENCAWPSVVSLVTDDSFCSGGLIHPQIVLTAAHCLEAGVLPDILFGEGPNGAQLVATEYCRANPEFTQLLQGTDFGFCRLAEPVTNVPIIPIAMGCEEEVIAAGRPVTHVGFGYDENDDYGRKRVITLPIQTITETHEFVTGSPGMAPCNGDSGSPVFAQLPAADGGDDTWRVVGIFSWLHTDCTAETGSVIASNAARFIETESGIDVTPCHTADGTWAPSGECKSFPLEPGVGGEGSYTTMCEPGPLVGESSACGPPLSSSQDALGPVLDVLSPQSGQRFEPTDGSASVVIDVTADDGDGWGVARVDLVIAPEDDDTTTLSYDYPPYRWNAVFPVGGYFLRLVATDHAGNITESEWIGIGIGVDAPTDPPGEDDTGSTSSGSTTDALDPDSTSSTTTSSTDGTESAGTTPADGDGSDSGCGCDLRAPSRAPWMLVLLGCAASRSRRRR